MNVYVVTSINYEEEVVNLVFSRKKDADIYLRKQKFVSKKVFIITKQKILNKDSMKDIANTNYRYLIGPKNILGYRDVVRTLTTAPITEKLEGIICNGVHWYEVISKSSRLSNAHLSIMADDHEKNIKGV